MDVYKRSDIQPLTDGIVGNPVRYPGRGFLDSDDEEDLVLKVEGITKL